MENSNCWEWLGSLTSDGYGVRRGKLAHRAAYEYFVGPIPKGLFVCHTCDNRKCVRAAHLFIGTAGDNNRDRAAKGRNNAIVRSGTLHVHAKIDDAIVRAIRASTKSTRMLAAKYGLSQSYVSKIKRRLWWKHVT